MIYFIQDQGVNHIKIGYTKDDAEKRLSQLQTGCPAGLVLLGTMRGDKDTETTLHKRFSHARVHGEWFRPVPELLLLIIDAVKSDEIREAKKIHTVYVERPQRIGEPDGLPRFLRSDSGAPVEKNKYHNGQVWRINCPVCGFDHNEIRGIVPVAEMQYRDDEFVELESGWTGHGEAGSILFSCTAGHSWSLNFGFHKGQSFLWVSLCPGLRPCSSCGFRPCECFLEPVT